MVAEINLYMKYAWAVSCRLSSNFLYIEKFCKIYAKIVYNKSTRMIIIFL